MTVANLELPLSMISSPLSQNKMAAMITEDTEEQVEAVRARQAVLEAEATSGVGFAGSGAEVHGEMDSVIPGIYVLRIINEPTAPAIAYVPTRRCPVNATSLSSILVVELSTRTIEEGFFSLRRPGRTLLIGMVIHSADHFLVDQLVVIVQLVRRLRAPHTFVSMLDYDSSDSTKTLLDSCEAVLTLFRVPFRIRRVPPMAAYPSAAYCPSEEAHTRNLVLEPLFELQQKRGVYFCRVL